ncbi:alpha/beta-glucosidase agdC [Rhizodiscina lignyota]|uniref:Alpha/beta-glucosidase agdC n=1 Tax=Rhizodiscina lignyota TaxID=1504668 RepID=A0A9P4M2M2_9PEZI|nr:alpha/beta-glucosidase agdC [Rhizodiscina lignyota]
MAKTFRLALLALLCSSFVIAKHGSVSDCPGYVASNVVHSKSGVTADLKLAGKACNAYGTDLTELKLKAEYQTDTRLHVQIYDPALQVYQVPTSVLARPGGTASDGSCDLEFAIVEKPFSFKVTRKSSGETLFDTSSSQLIFESQYLRLRTKLPESPHLYGLGEHTDPFMLNTTNYTRTLWSRDAYGVPTGSNLYGNHPIYFDHRGSSGTHGVFLLSSNGMDIKINKTSADGQYLEYNTIGGIFDLYFLAGPTPKDVAQQYAGTIGKPVMMPYWGFGFHQCKYGYVDVYQVAEVVANYSANHIPLETMWTDIDYMDKRKVFTLDPDRFPLEKMRELVSTLHARQQHYVVMVDPAVAYQDYPPFNNGVEQDAFLKLANGSVYKGVVWPGVTAFPDWFSKGAQGYWNSEFASFFSSSSGVDIDALWIDMNEASNFCNWPCSNPEAFAVENGDPPPPQALRNSATRPSIPGFPADFQPHPSSSAKLRRREPTGNMKGLPGRDVINPPYMIQNAAGSLSNKTLDTNLIHENGLVEYDTHNLYGTMMSEASRNAMENRRPGRRPLVITRSTFAGAGAHVGHWLGDNFSDWDHYRISIAELMAFAAIFQIPMVGSDVCGYAENTTETLCARWATLGAFSPFFRNHADIAANYQEFYRWPTVAQAARNAIGARYQLLDYIYTGLHTQTVSGTPLINPLFFNYPNDKNTFPIQYQYFYGDSVLVSPVTEENATSVDIYLPDDIFYDFWTHEPVRGHGATVHLADVPLTTIPLHYKGGSIIPLRAESANTTTELRKKNFQIIIAPGLDGSASGSLYLDEGDAIAQPKTSEINFNYVNGRFSMTGSFGYDAGVVIESIVLLGAKSDSGSSYSSTSRKSATTSISIPLTKATSVHLA